MWASRSHGQGQCQGANHQGSASVGARQLRSLLHQSSLRGHSGEEKGHASENRDTVAHTFLSHASNVSSLRYKYLTMAPLPSVVNLPSISEHPLGASSAIMIWKVSAVLVLVIVCVQAQDNPGLRAALRVYDECSRAQGFGACLKKKALVFVDRLSRMEKLTLADGISVVRAGESTQSATQPLTDVELEKTLPRALEAQDAALDSMLLERIGSYVSSRTLQVTLPDVTGKELSRSLEEGRGKMKKMMGMMMMGMAAKMAGMIPLAIAGLFMMAGKALMMSKIALLLAFIIALKKIVAQKQGGGGYGGGGHGGGWQSSGGGWDKRSYDEAQAAQKMAYKAYAPQQ